MTTATLESSIPLVDLSAFLSGNTATEDAARVTHSLENYGAVLVRDPRVSAEDANDFIDMMERYFAQPREKKLQDARPQHFYQVGATPDFTERPRDNSSIASHLSKEHRPRSDPSARAKDPKWRFFWRLGEIPPSTDYPQMNAAPVVPDAFKDEWAPTMNSWGGKLLGAVHSVAELLALGLALPRDAITKKMRYGAHLLAPTGSDMSTYGDAVGTTIAGYHYDISSLTIHARSRYPGLYIWRADGVRIPVVMPDGSLLVQTGQQIELLTAGRIPKGMHEVVVSEETADAARKARESGRAAWRVSSTLFAHIGSDESLKPLIGNDGKDSEYPDIEAGEQVASELKEIELAVF